MKRIDDTREQYRPCGKAASILFFVLNDLAKIDPMYQFSLDSYKKLFEKSINEARELVGGDKMKNIMSTHKSAVYKNTCRSLFERHKLLLSLQMLIKIRMSNGELDKLEWTFFLMGGTVLDRSTQPVKPPFDWISQLAWDNITEMEKKFPERFAGIANHITLAHKDWNRWYVSPNAPPEQAPLPGEWETKCEESPLRKLMVLRCLRPDRVIFALREFVEQSWKKEFTESKPTGMQDVYDASEASVPIIFVLSTGVDPYDQLRKLADKMGQKLESISLGRGQSAKAVKMLKDAYDKGNWVFLANCHLSISLLPELEQKIDEVFKGKDEKEINESKFRIFLSSSPHPDFPISLLQRSLKITQEPPRGIKPNMLKLYDNIGQ